MANIIEQINVAGTIYNLASTAYAEASQNASTAAKSINIDGFTLIKGTTIHVKFIEANSVNNPTLTISGGDSAANTPIAISGISTWPAGTVLTLTYDGTSWVRDYDETIANNITGSGTSGSLAKFNGPNSITDGPALTTAYDSSTQVTTSHKFLREDGTWVVPKYTTNSDTKLRTYVSTTDIELPIVGLNSGNATAAYASHTSSYKDVYGAIPSTSANRATINPSTGAIKVPGGIIGNASTATKFSSARSIALTGDVTGSASADGSSGWSITTTIGEGKVTNAMIANHTITIGSTTKNLGETFTLDDLGITAAMHFKGVTTTELTDDDTTHTTVVISGNNYTPNNGDVVLYEDSEFVWIGTKWERLGRDSSWALDSEVIKKSMLTSQGDIIYHDGTSVTRLAAGSNGHFLKLVNGVPTWAADNNSDTKVTQAYSTTNNSYPLLFSSEAGISSTNSRGDKTAIVNNALYVNPSTGELHATYFYGDGSNLSNIAASSVDWANVQNKVLAKLYVNTTSAGTNNNVETANDTTYIHLYDNGAVQDTIKLTGAGGASVTATNAKVITITSKTYTSKGTANALTSLKLKYTDKSTDPETVHDDAVSTTSSSPTALGTVTGSTLYIKSIYYGTTSVSTGVKEG